MDIRLLLLLCSQVFCFDLVSNPCQEITNYAVPHLDPQKYYYCDDGSALESRCPLGTSFDGTAKGCTPTEQYYEILLPPSSCGLLYCGDDDHWRDTDPKDCGNYYLCNYGTVILQHCPDGKHFNKSIGHCLQPNEARCENQPAYHVECHPEERWRGADLVDCTKYYFCEHGALYHVQCGEGMYYSNDKQICTTTIVAGCSNFIPTPPSFTTTSFTTSTLKPLPTCGPTETWKAADISSCTHYYQCRNGGYSYETCHDGLEFNPVDKECQPPPIAGCSFETTTLDYTAVTFTYAPPNSSSLITCMGFDLGPDPLECSAFYKCVNGKIEHLNCEWGYEFSVKAKECLPQEEAHCSSHITLVPKTTTDHTAPAPITLEPPSCGSHEEWLLPDYSDCSYYYRCSEGHVYHEQCPAPYEFSSQELDCRPQEEANCIPGTTLAPPPTTTTKPQTETTHEPKPTTLVPKTTTDDTTPAPITVEPPSCGSHEQWLLPDYSNCSYYYRCSEGHVHHEQCPAPYEFSSQELYCVPQEEADCSPRTTLIPKTTTDLTTPAPITLEPPSCGSHEEWLLPDYSDCSYYYRCTEGHVHHEQCPAPYEFSASTLYCLPQEEANCSPSTTLAPPQTTTNKPQTETTITPLTTHEPKPTTMVPKTTTDHTAPAPITLEPPSCGSHEEWLLPDYSDCSYYYRCSEGHVYHEQCPAPYMFNGLELYCVPEEEANCSPRTTLVPKTTTDHTAPAPITLEPPSCGSHEEWLLPDYSDCSYYYRCSKGHVYHEQCPTPYEFSSHELDCRPQAEANCSPGTTLAPPLTTTTKPQTETTLEPKPTTSVPKTTTDDTTPAPITLEPPSCGSHEEWLLPDYSDCSYYYRCSEGHVYHEQCPAPYMFNGLELYCVPQEEANCSPRTTLVTKTTTDHIAPAPITVEPPSCGSHEEWLLPDYSDCSYYYRCSEGHVYYEQCPAPYEFSSQELDCRPQEEANCIPGTTLAPPPTTTTKPQTETTHEPKPTTLVPKTTTDHTAPAPITLEPPSCGSHEEWLLPDYSDCSYYYRCSEGHVYHEQCPAPYEFSSQELDCRSQEEANCSPSTTLAPPLTTTTKPQTETTHKPKPTTLVPKTTTDDTTPAPITLEPPSCGSHEEWLLPDYSDCSYYYRCSEGHVYHEHCPAPYEFSSTELDCRPQEEANCSPGTTLAPPPSTTNKPQTETPYTPLTTDEPKPTTLVPKTTTEHTAPAPITVEPPSCGSHEEWLLPDYSDCSYYYRCSEGHVYHEQCPAPYEFSALNLDCRSQEEANCSTGTTLAPLPTTTNKPQTEATFTPLTTHEPKPTTFIPKTTTDDTTPAPITLEPPSCGSHEEWLLPDYSDCSYYYRCSEGHVFHEQCPAPYMFSGLQLNCVPQEEANCSPHTTLVPKTTTDHTTPAPITLEPPSCGSHEEWLLPDYSDCSYYYRCSEGHVHHEQCPAPYEFSSTELDCRPQEEANCIPGTTLAPPPTTTTKPQTETTHEPKPTTLVPKTTTDDTTPAPITVEPPTCGSHELWLLPDYSDCSYYYRCSEGHVYHEQCPAPYEFSSQELYCVPQEEADCSPRTTLIPKTTTDLTTPAPITLEPPSCGSHEEWLLPDYSDCSYYYRCSEGHVHHEQCPAPYEFSASTLYCLPQEEANCSPSTTLAPPQTTTNKPRKETTITPLTTHEPKLTTMVPKTTTDDTKPAPITLEPPSCGSHEEWLLPDYSDCSYYYRCSEGHIYREQCPAPYEFSSTELDCRPQEEANCSPGTTLAPPPSTTNKPQTETPYTPLTTDEPKPTTLVPKATTEHTAPAPITLEPPSCGSHEEWLLPDYSDCSYYYRCSEGHVYHEQCPAPYEFSALNLDCRSQEEANCSPGTTLVPLPTTNNKPQTEATFTPLTTHEPKPTTFIPKTTTDDTAPAPITLEPPSCGSHEEWLLPDYSDCSYYYRCSEGHVFHKQCPAPYMFSGLQLYCVPQEEANCSPRTTLVPKTTTDHTAPAPITLEPLSCGSHEQWLLPDYSDCSYYYRCSEGHVYHEHCPAPYEFSSTELDCRPQEEANCSPGTTLAPLPTTTTKPLTEATYTPLTTFEPKPTTMVPKTTTDNTTPAPITLEPLSCGSHEEWLLPDYSDCSYYYRCSEGHVYHEQCPAPYEFSSQDLDCRPQEEANCSPGTTLAPPPSTTNKPQTETPYTPLTTDAPKPTTLVPKTTTDHTTPAPITLEPPSCGSHEEWLLPDYSDCSYYYRCSEGHVYHEQCPAPYMFSGLQLYCVPEEEANCSPRTTLVPKTTTDHIAPAPITLEPPSCGSHEEWLLPDYSDCSYYYRCSEGHVYHEQCPSPYMFSGLQLYCVPEEEANCSPRTTLVPKTTTDHTAPAPITLEPPSCGSHEEWLLPDYSDCSYYYRCSEGHVYHEQCPSPYMFNGLQLDCRPQEEANCSPGTTLAPLPTTTTKPQTEATYTPLTTFEPKPTTLVPKTTTDDTTPAPITVEPPSCGSHEEWLLPDYSDCSYYYRCSEGHVFHEQCPAPYMFSGLQLYCVPQEEANCSPRTTLVPKTTTDHIAPAPITLEPLSCGSHEQWLLPDYSDCSYYYRCSEGHVYHEHCPAPYEFSSTELDCRPQEEANCSPGTTLAPLLTTTTKPQTEATYTPLTTFEPKPTTLIPKTTTDDTTPAPITLEPPSCGSHEEWLLPDYSDCSYYYRCSEGHVYHEQCPAPYEFSSTELDCRQQEEASCTPGTTLAPLLSTTTKPQTEATYTPLTTFEPKPTTLIPKTTTDDNAPAPTTLEPPSCGSHEEWLLPDYSDCSYYYRCSEGHVYHEQCPSPYMFSGLQLYCVPEEEANCSPRTTLVPKTTTDDTAPAPITLEPPSCGSHEEWLLPDYSDCSYYYRCSEGHVYHEQCPAPYEFSLRELECVPQEEANCSPRTTLIPKTTTDLITYEPPTTHEPKTTTYEPPTTHEPKTTTYEPPTTHESKTTTYEPFTLPTTKSLCNTGEYWKIPDSNNCSYYYVCYDGVILQEKCSEGNEFNPIELECLPKEIAGCDHQAPSIFTITTPPTTITPPTTVTTPTTPSASNGAAPIIIPIIRQPDCPTDLKCTLNDAYIAPDLNNCDYYYLCVKGQISHTKCPYDFDYSLEKKECLPKSMVNCVRPGIPTITPTTQSTTITPYIPIKCVNSTAKPLYFVVDDKDCRYYYMCALGTATRETCPQGYEFSSKYLVCLPSDEAQCGTLCSSNDVQFVPDPHDITRYYICFEGKPLPQKCPAGFNFHPSIQMCKEVCEE